MLQPPPKEAFSPRTPHPGPQKSAGMAHYAASCTHPTSASSSVMFLSTCRQHTSTASSSTGSPGRYSNTPPNTSSTFMPLPAVQMGGEGSARGETVVLRCEGLPFVLD